MKLAESMVMVAIMMVMQGCGIFGGADDSGGDDERKNAEYLGTFEVKEYASNSAACTVGEPGKADVQFFKLDYVNDVADSLTTFFCTSAVQCATNTNFRWFLRDPEDKIFGGITESSHAGSICTISVIRDDFTLDGQTLTITKKSYSTTVALTSDDCLALKDVEAKTAARNALKEKIDAGEATCLTMEQTVAQRVSGD